MNSLFQYTSNSLTNLAQELAQLLSQPTHSPLRPEIVVVQSLGLRRWLKLELARINGVCANVEFPFLSNFIASIPPGLDLGERLSPRVPVQELTWAIYRLLPILLKKPEFAVVRAYLSDRQPLKAFQFSRRIADLFDQYVVYRSAMSRRWEKNREKLGGDEAWQRTLWRALAADPALTKLREEQQQEQVHRSLDDLPKQFFVFGLTSIPPAHLHTLFELSKVRPVHLFFLKVSKEYHGQDLTPKRRTRLGLKEGEAPIGNPLLTSLGASQAQLTDLIFDTDQELGLILVEKAENFRPPAENTLLGLVQTDIFHARNRGGATNDKEDAPNKITVSPNDQSIVIHSCHSPMREVEVIHDRLLELFEKDRTLRPRDILVLTPDIEKYSPIIRAVFEYPEQQVRKIPYSVSDRHPRSESPVIDSFLQLMELGATRCTGEEVFGLISSAVIARRFHFAEDELSQIRSWIRDTGICWAINATQRRRFGVPAEQANTWRFGLDRLLLGYGMRGRNKTLFNHILPYDEVEGEGGELLGRFVSAVETVFALVERFQVPHSVEDWATLLREAVDSLFDSDNQTDLRDLAYLRRSLSALGRATAQVSTGQPVELAVVRAHLEDLFSAKQQRGGFLTGGVTFSALKPGRTIPARVIFVLGLNDDLFPRRPQPAQFDLLKERRLGDPCPRQDDRSAFLETICAAKECLQITYLGRSVIHNEEIPPSIVVNELIDYLDQAFTFPDNTRARDYLTLKHPLQAFNPLYFKSDAPRLFSYSDPNAAAATALVEPAPAPAAFLSGPLPELSEAERSITLNQLISFLANPARSFLRVRFRLDLNEYDDSLSDSEPIQLGGLEKYSIRQALLAEHIDSGKANLEIFAARGITPLGVLGRLQVRSLDHEAAEFASVVLPYITPSTRAQPMAFDLKLGEEFSLTGQLESVYGPNLIHYRCTDLKIRDWITAWVEHLARSAIPNSEPFKTVLIGKDDVVSWNPLRQEAAELLIKLCRIYWRGLHEALPLFPQSAFAYVKSEREGKDGFRSAMARWNGNWDQEGEKSDPSIQKLYPVFPGFNKEFVEIAQSAFGPLLQYAK